MAVTSKSVLGKIDDNPLAKALRARKVSGMRLWGSAHNALVQERISKTKVSKIGGWSQCASWLWHNKLTDEQHAEWTKRAAEVGDSDAEQCFWYVTTSITGVAEYQPCAKGTSLASVHFWPAYCQALLALAQLRSASLVSQFALCTGMQTASWFSRNTWFLAVRYAHKY